MSELKQIAEAQVKFIMGNREKFVSAFIAETGLHPSECVMLEHKNDNGLVTSISFERNTHPISSKAMIAEGFTVIACTGCGWVQGVPFSFNAIACCPDSNYKKHTLVCKSEQEG